MTNTATIAISMKVQTSPMLASGAQLLGCGILALNITKQAIMTGVIARLKLED